MLQELNDVVLGLTVAERLVQRAELPLQSCRSLLQILDPPGQLALQPSQSGFAGRQTLPHLLLRGGTEAVEVTDLQDESIVTSRGAQAQQVVSGRVQLLHLPLLSVHSLQQSLEIQIIEMQSERVKF